jgi:hypothetical protein
MSITTWLQESLGSFSRAVARIFSPNDDHYPATGAQPYDGDPYDEKQSDR